MRTGSAKLSRCSVMQRNIKTAVATAGKTTITHTNREV